MKQHVLVIVGPTASGKTALGIALAKEFDGEVLSADSRQVYRGLDIGTGKATKREMKGIPHHLLDVASPKRVFTAGDFVRKARVAVREIDSRGKLPIVVGGTGFYIDALVGRISLPAAAPNKTLRARLEKKSAPQLFRLLQKRDPRRAKQMSSPSERNNKVRLIRALEVAAARPQSEKRSPPYDVLWIGIEPPIKLIEKNIHERLIRRIRAGMIEEARRLHRGGLSFKCMEQLGLEYRSLARYLQKKISKDELVAELDRDIRRYAKKQLGYWKRNREIAWFRPAELSAIQRAASRWLNATGRGSRRRSR